MSDSATRLDRRAIINTLMDDAGSQFLSVEFVKKDGTTRLMTCQLAAGRKLLAGDDASDSAKQGVETRKANNPHLRNVYSIDSHAWRSVNLDTILTIKSNGVVWPIGNIVLD
jgi:hypothetical protein